MKDLKSQYINQQTQKFRRGRIGRRAFITSMLSAGVTIPTAIGMATQVIAQTPQRGGTMRLGLGHGSTTDSLDPGTYENDMTIHMAFLYGNMLTVVETDGSVSGEIAETFEPLDGGKSWAFNLRSGVTFHNGKSLAPEDVIATLNYHRGEDSTSAAKGILSGVVDVRKDGDMRVVVELNEANADFPFIVSDYHLLILPSAEDGSVDPTAGIGTGPYKIETFEPGVRLIASRNESYMYDGKPNFDSYQVISLKDVTARQGALMNGEVDVIDGVDPKTVALLGRSPNVNIQEVTGTLHYTFPMRVNAAPFDNNDLRMALKLSVKRQEMVDKILLGHGALGNDHPISTANRFHADDIPQREFDPEKAAEHYKKSGHSGPVKIQVSDAAFTGAVDAAQLMAASAAEAGITIDVERVPSDGYWSNIWNKEPWSASYWGGRPTEDWMFSAAYTDDTEWNETAWTTGEAAGRFNSVVRTARAELDDVKRAALYKEAQMLVRDEGGAILPMFANYINGLSSKVSTGEQVAANWNMDGHKASERWWFNS